MSATSLLALEGLTVRYAGADPARPALDGFDLSVDPGEIVALLGESGGGKTTAGLAVPALLPPTARCEGRILWRGEALDAARRARLRGREIGLTFQDPLAALDPVWTIGGLLRETLLRLRGGGRRRADALARGLLAEVRLPAPESVLAAHPHALSGGQRQRVLLALALAGDPSLLIADEPTTALDAPLRRGVLDLLADLSRTRGLAVLLITHDEAAARGVAHRIVRLRAGRRCVEATASAPAAFPSPQEADTGGPALRCTGLTVEWPGRRRLLGPATARRAVDAVDLLVGRGETVGLVGESGCGKTSLALAVCGFVRPAAGEALVAEAPGGPGGRHAYPAQLVFQDPASSLDPRRTALASVTDGAAAAGASDAGDAARELLRRVGLASELWTRRPHGLSGGQRQRVVLARALAARPSLLVADEPTSSLDPAARAGVLELFAELQREQGWGLLLISHDLPLVRALCNRTAVMLAGRLVEVVPAGVPVRHPYSRALLDSAVATAGRERPDAGCPWRNACEFAEAVCDKQIPSWAEPAAGHFVRCPITARNGGTR